MRAAVTQIIAPICFLRPARKDPLGTLDENCADVIFDATGECDDPGGAGYDPTLYTIDVNVGAPAPPPTDPFSGDPNYLCNYYGICVNGGLPPDPVNPLPPDLVGVAPPQGPSSPLNDPGLHAEGCALEGSAVGVLAFFGLDGLLDNSFQGSAMDLLDALAKGTLESPAAKLAARRLTQKLSAISRNQARRRVGQGFAWALGFEAFLEINGALNAGSDAFLDCVHSAPQ